MSKAWYESAWDALTPSDDAAAKEWDRGAALLKVARLTPSKKDDKIAIAIMQKTNSVLIGESRKAQAGWKAYDEKVESVTDAIDSATSIVSTGVKVTAGLAGLFVIALGYKNLK